MYCYTSPGGQRKCVEFGVPLEPVDPNSPDPVILNQLGRLQEMLAQVSDKRLMMQLSMVLDETVARIGSQLPAGYEFRRAATHDFPEDGFFDPGPLPNVVGLHEADGVEILRAAGYDVTEEKEPVSSDTEDIILSQLPPGDVITSPPGTVIIRIGRPPWITSTPTFHPPEKFPVPGDIA